MGEANNNLTDRSFAMRALASGLVIDVLVNLSNI
jgi:hypothetical protein